MKDNKTLIKISNSKASSVNGSPKPQTLAEDAFAAVTGLSAVSAGSCPGRYLTAPLRWSSCACH